jgi:hypothetical protein
VKFYHLGGSHEPICRISGSRETVSRGRQYLSTHAGCRVRRLKEDIRTNGLLEPVWLHPESHTIVDGRNRHRACVELGISPKFRYWDGKGSLVGFVVSLNLKRRHLTPSQASMIGADILPMLEEEAHKKQLSTLKQNAATVEANLPQRSGDRAQQARDQAAAIIGVSPRSIQDAKTVRKQGSDELVRAVKEGHVAVSTAAIIAQAPPEDQIVIVAQGPKQIVEASKKIRTKKSAEKRAERVEKINRISQGNKPLTEVVNRLYPVIYADPPWEYDHSETESREIGNQYPTMSVDKICSLPIDKVAAPDCVLILWATSPKLLDAMHVIESWGFTYKTCMVWTRKLWEWVTTPGSSMNFYSLRPRVRYPSQKIKTDLLLLSVYEETRNTAQSQRSSMES